MKIGIVNPYSFDVPGGVQFHIRDLANWLLAHGHDVSVLAPADSDTELPDYVVSTGKSLAIPYNGSVARLSFGPQVSRRVASWLENDFDVLHIHEPLVPSLSMLALRQAETPVVATFHSNQQRSRAMWLVRSAVQPLLEAITAPIAVSQEARRTIVEHLGVNPVVIPNGVDLHHFDVEPVAKWQGSRHSGDPSAPVISFLGRLDEPRKGLAVLAGAIKPVLQRFPHATFLIAGAGSAQQIRAELAEFGERVRFLGGISEQEKAQLFASADLYVAPQTGGESFGIVLVEAMAAGCGVVASDIRAFRDVLDQGRAGRLFRNQDSNDLAATIISALSGEQPIDQQHVANWRAQFDWDEVGRKIVAVYQCALQAGVHYE